MYIKYFFGNIKVEVRRSKDEVFIKVCKPYPEIHKLEGKGFKLDDKHNIVCKCDRKTYGLKIRELERLVYEIEVKKLQISKTIKKEIKAVKDDNKHTSNTVSVDKGGNSTSHPQGNTRKDKEEK